MLARSIAESFKALRDVKEFGIVADGSTGISTNLNNAITTLSSAGGGWLVFPPNTNAYMVDSTITLKKNVYLSILPGAVLQWSGSAGGTMFTSPADRVLIYAGVMGGGKIKYQDASIVFNLHSHQICLFSDLHFIAYDVSTVYSIDSIIFKMTSDSSATTDSPYGLKNIVNNDYDNLYQGGWGWAYATGKFFEFNGQTSIPITLNNFHNISAHMISRKALDFVSWTDNNMFTGVMRFNVYGNNSVGVDMNSGNPSVNNEVYLNNFHHLAVDTFYHPGVPGFESFTGRIGLKLGHSRHTKIDNFYNQMADVGGASIQDNYSQSHYIVFHDYDMVGQPIRLVSKNLSGFAGSMTVKEVDGSPSVSATTIKFPNGSLTDNGGGVVTVAFSDSIDGGAFSDTYINTADIDGGAF